MKNNERLLPIRTINTLKGISMNINDEHETSINDGQ